jgi:hypothetical protein
VARLSAVQNQPIARTRAAVPIAPEYVASSRRISTPEHRHLHRRRTAKEHPDVVAAAGLPVRVRADLGGICGTRCIVDVGPMQLATDLQFGDDVRVWQDHAAVSLEE